MNTEKIKSLIKQLVVEIENAAEREGTVETPQRVAQSFTKIFKGYQEDPLKHLKLFGAENYDEMIIVKDIDFFSTCEHHLLTFFGKAVIGYIPDKKILGASKFCRIVECFSRRLQNQERLTSQITDFLHKNIKPKGIGVVIKAQHMCMLERGVEKINTSMTTSSFRGLFKNNLNTRQEFLRLANGSLD